MLVEEFFIGRAYDYPPIIRELGSRLDLNAREEAVLGMSLFRVARFDEAEPHLRCAVEAGVPEALAEYGALLVGQLRFDEAKAHLERALETLTEFPRFMAVRWLGLATILGGDLARGVGLLERAWRGFHAIGGELGERGMGITAHQLGAALVGRGDYVRAARYLRQGVAHARMGRQPALLVDALLKQFMLHAHTNDLDAADRVMNELRALRSAGEAVTPYFHVQVAVCDVIHARLHRKTWAFTTRLAKLRGVLRDKPHPEALFWIGPVLLDSLSRTGLHGLALKILNASVPDERRAPMSVRVVEGVILMRSGAHTRAAEVLRDLAQSAFESGERVDAARAELYLAGALLRAGRTEEVAEPLVVALRELSKLGVNFVFRDDLADLRDLLAFANRHEKTRPLARLLRGEVPPQERREPLVLETLGRTRVLVGATELSFRLDAGEVTLALTFLRLHPNSTIAQLADAVFSEKTASAGRSYARQVIMLARQVLGEDAIFSVQERRNGEARYRLAEHLSVDLDLERLYDALDARDFDAVFEVYRGRFAPGRYGLFVEETMEELERAVVHGLRGVMSTPGLATPDEVQRWVRCLIDVAGDDEEARDVAFEVETWRDEKEHDDAGLALAG